MDITSWGKEPNKRRLNTNLILHRIIEICKDKLGVNEVTIDSHFQNDLGADSLDLVELLMEAEREFNVAITDMEAEGISTVREAVILIARKTGAETPGMPIAINKNEEVIDHSNDEWLKPIPVHIEEIKDKRFLTTLRRFTLNEDWTEDDVIQGEPRMRDDVLRIFEWSIGLKGDILEEVIGRPNFFINVSKLKRQLENGNDKVRQNFTRLIDSMQTSQLPLRYYNDSLRTDYTNIRLERINTAGFEVQLQNNLRVKKTMANLSVIEPIGVRESSTINELRFSLKKMGSAYKRKKKALAKLNEDITDLEFILQIEED